MQVHCKYKDTCSGCQYLDLPFADQHRLKKTHLEALLREAQIPFNGAIGLVSPGAAHLRDRADLIYDRGALGLFDKVSRQITDLEECQQLSPRLQLWLAELRNFQWPIQKGSLRLRVGPGEQKGIWLD